MLENLKSELLQLIANDRLKELFDRLIDRELRPGTVPHDMAIGLRGRFSRARKQWAAGTVAAEDQSVLMSRLTEAATILLEEIREGDLTKRKAMETPRFIPDYHALGVDRKPQTQQFKLDRALPEDPNRKVHFYYVHGDRRQQGESLIRRIGYEHHGFKLSANMLAANRNGRDVSVVECRPEPCDHPLLFRIELMKELLLQFIGPIDEQDRLLEKTLIDLLPSDRVTGKKSIFITVLLDHYNWDKAVVPAVLRELFENFCQAELPTGSPDFFFFFGVEYPREKSWLREEILTAIAHRRYGEALEELAPVTFDDICAWFTRHRPLLSGAEEDDFTREHFGEQPAYDMADVETTLRRLIDRHNETLI